MPHNFWAISDVIKTAYSGEIRQPERNQKWSVLSRGKHCTIFAADVGAEEGYPLHIHKHHDEVMIILKGEGEAIIGNERRRVKPGDFLFAPAGTAHTIRFAGVLLAIDSPAFDTEKPDREIVE